MGFSGLCPWLFGAYNGAQAQFRVHVLMNGSRAVMVSYPLQINRHAPITIYAMMVMVDVPDLLLALRLVRIIRCLPVLSVIIIGIRTNPQSPQQPADSEFLMMFLNESVSL